MTVQQNYIYNKMNKDGTNSNVNVLSFDTTYNPLLIQTGQMGWNGDEGTFNMKLYSDSVLQVGQETHYYGIAEEVIPNASVVMISGVLGNRIKFKRATADSVINNPKVILGIATSDMTQNGYGYVTQFGNVNDVKTLAGWLPEDILYYDIEASYLYRFNTSFKPRYLELLAKPYLLTKTLNSTIAGTTATIYFNTIQATAPYAVGQLISVKDVLASGADPITCYQVSDALVTECTTQYIKYTIPTAPTGVTTITQNGAIDGKAVSEQAEFNLLIANVQNIINTKTPGEVVWTGTGTIIDPYLLNFTAFDAYLANPIYSILYGNGLLTKVVPSGSFLKIPLATVILKSDNTFAGRLLVRPDVSYRFSQISDIYINNLQNNDTLRYNEAGGYWFNTPSEASASAYNPDNVYFASTIYANGGNIATENSTTFNLINEYATTMNFAGAATAVNIGAPTGTLTVNNPTVIGSNSTQNLFNTIATTMNFAGAATSLNMGASAGTTTLNGQLKLPHVVTQAGDLIYSSDNQGTLARLGKGTADQFLKMSSDGTTLQWGTVAVPGGLTAGSSSSGFINYNGTSKTAGQWYGGTTAPTSTTRLNYDGYLYATQVWGAVFNDYAEFFKKDDEIEAGDVIVKNPNGDGFIKSTKALDRTVVGVLSDNFGHILGADGNMTPEENKKHYAAVGLAGRVHVKVVGQVYPGDLLVSSDVAGHAMVSKEYVPGTVIGKALETPKGGKVLMLIVNM